MDATAARLGMTTRDASTGSATDAWVNLRDEHGRIQARYHPGRHLLMIVERRVVTVHELGRFERGIDGAEQEC